VWQRKGLPCFRGGLGEGVAEEDFIHSAFSVRAGQEALAEEDTGAGWRLAAEGR